jgi:hypothetical protein
MSRNIGILNHFQYFLTAEGTLSPDGRLPPNGRLRQRQRRGYAMPKARLPPKGRLRQRQQCEEGAEIGTERSVPIGIAIEIGFIIDRLNRSILPTNK